MYFIIKITPGHDVRTFDRYLARSPRILAPIARKNLSNVPDISEGSDVLMWRNDMRDQNGGGLMGVGRTSSAPQRAENDMLADEVGVIVKANDWYAQIDVSERFESPSVHMEDIRRLFSATDFLQHFETRRANVSYPIEAADFQLIRNMAMPTVLDEFHARTRGIPRSTEVERSALERVGQDLFRRDLLRYWRRRCAISGLAVPELLRASHARPWARCETDDDRLNCFNGLLLAAHLDAAFENGLIGVEEDGTVLVSDRLDPNARHILGLDIPSRIERLRAEHQPWLTWHRINRFERFVGT